VQEVCSLVAAPIVRWSWLISQEHAPGASSPAEVGQ
jgi:hypothetical protein